MLNKHSCAGFIGEFGWTNGAINVSLFDPLAALCAQGLGASRNSTQAGKISQRYTGALHGPMNHNLL